MEIFKLYYHIKLYYYIGTSHLEEIKIKPRTVIIIGAIIWIIGMLLFFLTPVVVMQTFDTSLFFLMAGIGGICSAIGFFTFTGGIIYWFIARPKKIMMVDGSGTAIKQQTVVQTEKVETETFKKSITKNIKCPSCGEIKEVQGVLGERVKITCSKCNQKGFVQFR